MEALRCREAGAAMVHIHARDPKTRQASGDPAIFSDIIQRIRCKCDMLIQTTTGIGITGQEVRPGNDERVGLLSVDPTQDLATIPPGSWDSWRPGGSTAQKPDATYHNTPAFLRKNIAAIVAKGLPWEMEIAGTGFLNNALRLAEEGIFDRHSTRFWLDYCMGFGAMPATARTRWAQRWAATSSGSDSRTTFTCPMDSRRGTITNWSQPWRGSRANRGGKWRRWTKPSRFSEYSHNHWESGEK